MAIKHVLLLAVASICFFAIASARIVPMPVKKPVGTCPPVDGANPTYLPDGSDCHLFYECSGGVPNLKECLPELCFDSNLNVCAFPNRTLEIPQAQEASFVPLSAVGTCPPRDTNETIFLPDSADCAIYYQCSNGQAIKKECPPDMSWHNEAQICDWAIDSECTNGNSSMPFSAVGKCPPRDTNETIFLPDSADCAIYYQCSNGQAIKKECPPDMSWHNEAQICDWAIDSECTNGNATFRRLPREAVGTCPIRDTNVTVFLPDSKNCSMYYICSNGRPLSASCSPGMVWSTKLNVCDWDFDNNCVADSEQARAAPRSAVGTCPPKNGEFPVFLPDSEDCQVYYECNQGLPIKNVCPGDLQFNPALNVCDWGIDSNCVADSKRARPAPRSAVGKCPPLNGAQPVYLPDSEDCQLYYECDEGIPIQNNCPGDLEFNPTLHVCDNPLDAGCKATGGNSTEPTLPPTDVAPTEEMPSTSEATIIIG